MDITQQHLEAIESSQGFTKVDNEKAAEESAEITEQVAIDFAEWVRDKLYVRYFGSDGPNCNKWHQSYTMPDRNYYTTKELFELYKTQTK